MTEFEREKEQFKAYIDSEEYKEKLVKRLKIAESCAKNKSSRGFAYALCQRDPIFFIENFLFTFDPRSQHNPNHLPLFLFEYQIQYVKDLIDHIQNGKDFYVDKSRDMGVTWTTMAAFVYLWLFDDAFAAHIGSRKQDLVDNRTIDSLFGIFDYYLHSLPRWILPTRFSFDKHRQYMKLLNPENQNLITGESMNPDFARGPRKKVVFFDEFAFWDFGQEAWSSAGDTTPCRIAVTTPNGYNFCAILKDSGIDYMSLHWKLHPLKDEQWYKFECERRTAEEVAQELDISYNKSQEGRVYPEWDRVQFSSHPYNENFSLFVAWDYGQTDDTGMIWFQSIGTKVIILDCYWNRGKTIDFYIPFVTGEKPLQDYRYSKRDLEVIEAHKGWKKAIHYGDPAGRFTNQVTNQSVHQVLKNNGINVIFREEAKDFQTRKTATKLLMKNLAANDNERTKYLSTCIYNASYPRIRESGGKEVRSVKPIHNWTSHLRSALEYFAVNFQKFAAKPMRVFDQFPQRQHR